MLKINLKNKKYIILIYFSNKKIIIINIQKDPLKLFNILIFKHH